MYRQNVYITNKIFMRQIVNVHVKKFKIKNFLLKQFFLIGKSIFNLTLGKSNFNLMLGFYYNFFYFKFFYT